jgi:hypothetical protein
MADDSDPGDNEWLDGGSGSGGDASGLGSIDVMTGDDGYSDGDGYGDPGGADWGATSADSGAPFTAGDLGPPPADPSAAEDPSVIPIGAFESRDGSDYDPDNRLDPFRDVDHDYVPPTGPTIRAGDPGAPLPVELPDDPMRPDPREDLFDELRHHPHPEPRFGLPEAEWQVAD